MLRCYIDNLLFLIPILPYTPRVVELDFYAVEREDCLEVHLQGAVVFLDRGERAKEFFFPTHILLIRC